MRGGPRPMIRDETEAALKDMVKSDNHLTLAEYRDRLADRTEIRVIPGRWAGPQASGAQREKEDLACDRAGRGRILEERQAWPETIAGIAVERFVFLDESAARTDLVRSHGWSPCGERAPGTAPCGHWERVTILGALGPEGIVAAMSIPAATDGAVFCAWLEQVLLPELRRIRPDAVLVMDNLAAHKTQAVRALLDGSGFAYRYLPRYSPDSDPISPPGPR